MPNPNARLRAAGLLLIPYRYFLSPLLHALGGAGSGCRFEPTCSHYAQEAISVHGWLRGSALAIWRVLRCNPFSKSGTDPVPRAIASPSQGAS